MCASGRADLQVTTRQGKSSLIEIPYLLAETSTAFSFWICVFEFDFIWDIWVYNGMPLGICIELFSAILRVSNIHVINSTSVHLYFYNNYICNTFVCLPPSKLSYIYVMQIGASRPRVGWNQLADDAETFPTKQLQYLPQLSLIYLPLIFPLLREAII